MKNRQESLTIVSVTGSQDYAQGSVFAISRSYNELKNRISSLRCLLISPQKPEALPDYIEHIEVKPFSYFEYNFFMLYSLGQLIETDFALIVQNDGWVMNGQNWRDEFFDYDYIGAPIPILMKIEEERYLVVEDSEFWSEHCLNIPDNMYEPQNGGFSLRSRRLLNAPRDLGLSVEVLPPQFNRQTHMMQSWPKATHIEDIFLTGIKRRTLEAYGFRFAPSNIAAGFSLETPMVNQKYAVPIEKVLGGHFVSKLVLAGENKVLMKCKWFNSVEELREDALMSMLLTLGHDICIPAEFNVTEKRE
ncbi:DUF5672 family protein [Rodentibacter caecimuris]|uniref:DUF5672 domain-containing protein n=1 Tax=Rodentibacter caecimuris TaxID=1796644 RepID=A0ABX3KWE0_9PAST|nr:hypothetical protein BKG89_08800 [Rodentibacter heylii]